MGNIARQASATRAARTNNSGSKKQIKQKSWISPGEKILGISLWSFGLFWFRPYHFQSGINLPSK